MANADNIYFPDPGKSNAEGLVAIGGNLCPDRLLIAYKNGIFPWETEPIIGWYCPDPRCILLPENVRVSKSMQAVLRSDKYQFKINSSFNDVILHCKKIKRKGVEGSWISEEIIDSFLKLHQGGYAYSDETWQDEKLVGGLYGLIIGKVFFGESMFSLTPNASKFALIKFSSFLIENNIALIDCQVHSEHIESMGAILISRALFLKKVKYLTN